MYSHCTWCGFDAVSAYPQAAQKLTFPLPAMVLHGPWMAVAMGWLLQGRVQQHAPPAMVPTALHPLRCVRQMALGQYLTVHAEGVSLN